MTMCPMCRRALMVHRLVRHHTEPAILTTSATPALRRWGHPGEQPLVAPVRAAGNPDRAAPSGALLLRAALLRARHSSPGIRGVGSRANRSVIATSSPEYHQMGAPAAIPSNGAVQDQQNHSSA